MANVNVTTTRLMAKIDALAAEKARGEIINEALNEEIDRLTADNAALADVVARLTAQAEAYAEAKAVAADVKKGRIVELPRAMSEEDVTRG